MQETRYFDEDGEMQKHKEFFQVESENQEKAMFDMKAIMDERLSALQKQGHFLADRKEIDQKEYNAKGKPKKVTAKERKRRKKMKHAF